MIALVVISAVFGVAIIADRNRVNYESGEITFENLPKTIKFHLPEKSEPIDMSAQKNIPASKYVESTQTAPYASDSSEGYSNEKLLEVCGYHTTEIANEGDTLYSVCKQYDDNISIEYEDANGNVYYYDEKGCLTGFFGNGEYSTVAMSAQLIDALSQDEIIKIARKFIYDVMGDRVNNYQLDNIVYREETNSYHIIFCEYYKFAKGESCDISVLKNGVVTSWHTYRMHDYDDFDISLMDNITEQQILDYVDEYVKDNYGEKEYECDGIGVYKNKNGGYCISASVKVFNNTGWGVDMIGVDYPLS